MCTIYFQVRCPTNVPGVIMDHPIGYKANLNKLAHPLCGRAVNVALYQDFWTNIYINVNQSMHQFY